MPLWREVVAMGVTLTCFSAAALSIIFAFPVPIMAVCVIAALLSARHWQD